MLVESTNVVPWELDARANVCYVAPQVAVLSVAEVTPEVAPDVVGVVGDEGELNDRGGDLTVEDGYESANV